MKKKYQNIFFIFGLAVLAVMITQLDFTQVWRGLSHAGYWFLAVLVLWTALYGLNTSAWMLLIRGTADPKAQGTHKDSQGNTVGDRRVSFLWLYKVTVSGFALNYATPGGLMGGEPYRIMELAPRIGTERASSSVILYAMTHIFSHFWFWLLNIFIYIIFRPVNFFTGLLLAAAAAFCILGLWFFIIGYQKGLANKVMALLRHIPIVKRWARPFVEKHRAQLDTIDCQIAAMHRQNPRFFVSALLLELLCRFLGAFEVMFLLLVLMPSVSYVDCVLIMAFTTLFANLLFFMPLQLGGREGGFLMSSAALGLSAGAGIFVALLVRLRELIWTGIGLLFIKIKG